MRYTALLLLRDQMTQHILSRTDTERKNADDSFYWENFITHHETSITVNYFALSIIGQLLAHHKYISMLHTNKKREKDNGTGGKACLFMKAQGLSLDRKHVCLWWGHVVSLGLQYAKMSSTDPKRLNYYHLNSKNTLQITLNSKLGCGYSTGQ